MNARPAERIQPVRATATAAPRVSTAPGQRFLPQTNHGGIHMGSLPLVGGVGSREPFMGSRPMGQPAPVEPPKPEPSPRGKAWGHLKKMEAEELAEYLGTIADRMEELEMPPGIVRQVEEKLRAFVKTAAPNAELQLTESEIAELDAAILSYEEVESKEKVKYYAIGAVVIAGLGIGAAILL